MKQLQKNDKSISLHNDRKNNSRILKEIPGLKETVTTQLGNCIFIPATSEDASSGYHVVNIEIDGKPQLICKPKNTANRNSLQVYPAEAFDYEGTEMLFENSGIPVEYKEMVLTIACLRKDPSYLEVAFNPEEQIKLTQNYQDHFKIDFNDN